MAAIQTFGVVVAGRPLDTGFQQVECNKFLISIANANSINHIVVFLTGVMPLPAGTAASIFFSMPDPAAPPSWQYLGFITNEKPSAIYRLTNLTRNSQNPALNDPTNPFQPAFNYVQSPIVNLAQVGISIEPLNVVADMVPAIETPASNVTAFTEFINKTVGNLYNYCSSFSCSPLDIAQNPIKSGNNPNYIPLSCIQTWYENYLRRLGNDPNFWKSLK